MAIKKLRTRGRIYTLYGGPARVHAAARRVNAGKATDAEIRLVQAYFAKLRRTEGVTWRLVSR